MIAAFAVTVTAHLSSCAEKNEAGEGRSRCHLQPCFMHCQEQGNSHTSSLPAVAVSMKKGQKKNEMMKPQLNAAATAVITSVICCIFCTAAETVAAGAANASVPVEAPASASTVPHCRCCRCCPGVLLLSPFKNRLGTV